MMPIHVKLELSFGHDLINSGDFFFPFFSPPRQIKIRGAENTFAQKGASICF